MPNIIEIGQKLRPLYEVTVFYKLLHHESSEHIKIMISINYAFICSLIDDFIWKSYDEYPHSVSRIAWFIINQFHDTFIQIISHWEIQL